MNMCGLSTGYNFDCAELRMGMIEEQKLREALARRTCRKLQGRGKVLPVLVSWFLLATSYSTS